MLATAHRIRSAEPVADRVHRAFQRIPDASLRELLREVRGASRSERLVYVRKGGREVITAFAEPLVVSAAQLRYLRSVARTIDGAFRRLAALYLADGRVRDVLRLPPAEEELLRNTWTPQHAQANPIYARHDAAIDFASPDWKDSLQFLETNLNGVGGVHLLPATERVVRDVMLPAVDPSGRFGLRLGDDMRDLLWREIVRHLEAIGRPGRRICFVEFDDGGSGPDEQPEVARYLQQRFGADVRRARPDELELRRGEVLCRGSAVDLVYRDCSLQELLGVERDGADISGMRQLFRENRVLSGLGGELDQKAACEVLTDPELCARHFTAADQRVFLRHVAWTRLLTERRILLPEGRIGDLFEFARRSRERLVLKPNRGYGGYGIIVGAVARPSAWEKALDRAAREPGGWVVQSFVDLPVHEFPRLDKGRVRRDAYYCVMGFAPAGGGLAILGRASPRQVVNVAQRGGMCAVVTAR